MTSCQYFIEISVVTVFLFSVFIASYANLSDELMPPPFLLSPHATFLPSSWKVLLSSGNVSSLICCVQISPSFQVYERKRGPFKVETSPSNILFSFMFYLSSLHQIALNKLPGNFSTSSCTKYLHSMISILCWEQGWSEVGRFSWQSFIPDL